MVALTQEWLAVCQQRGCTVLVLTRETLTALVLGDACGSERRIEHHAPALDGGRERLELEAAGSAPLACRAAYAAADAPGR